MKCRVAFLDRHFALAWGGFAILMCAGCNYDFDQFATDSTLPAGGSGGEPASGSGSSGAAGGGVSACAGKPYDGHCWYLSGAGESCDDACANHGRVSRDAAAFVGTASQGGSLATCATLLGVLGVSQRPIQGFRSDGLGLGCHLYGQSAYWLRTPSYDSSASLKSAQLVCGCDE